MSGLVKADAAVHLARSFSVPVPTAPAEARPFLKEEDAGEDRLAPLREENAALASALEALRASIPDLKAAAREEGREEGRAAMGKDQDRQIEAVRAGLGRAVAAWQERLDEMDRLAPLLARSALAKLFDAHDDHSDFVLRVIGRQMNRIRRETLVRIRVSPRDFADEAALAGVAASAGIGPDMILVDADLAAGESRVDLTLGHIDLGISAQWGRLSTLLAELADEDCLA